MKHCKSVALSPLVSHANNALISGLSATKQIAKQEQIFKNVTMGYTRNEKKKKKKKHLQHKPTKIKMMHYKHFCLNKLLKKIRNRFDHYALTSFLVCDRIVCFFFLFFFFAHYSSHQEYLCTLLQTGFHSCHYQKISLALT